MKKVMVAIQVGLAVFFLGMVGATASEPEMSANGNWTYDREVDPLTDADQSYVANTTAEGTEMFFFASCSEQLGGPIITFSFGAFVGNPRGRAQEVQYRFMGEVNGEAQQDTWIHINGEYVVATGSVVFELLRDILKYDTLIIRTHDYRDRPHTMEFDLSGEEGFLSRLPCLDFLRESTALDAADATTTEALDSARNPSDTK